MINLSSGSLGLVIQNSLASFTLNTALQERIFLAGTGIVYFTGLSLLALIAAKKLEFGPLKLLTIVLLAHTLGSAIIRNFFHYSYDAPFVGPCFQYADMFGFILACYWGGHAVLRRQVDVLQKIAAGFAAMLVLSMTIYFTVGFPNVSIRTTSQVSLCFVLGLCGLTYFRRKDFVGFFNLEKTWYNDARFYCLIFLAMPILVYLGAPAPPDNNIVQSSDLLGFAVNSSGLLNAHTGFADEVWRIRYPAGIVGALWIPTFMFGTRSIESSFIMWVFSWVLYILANISLSKHFRIPGWLAALLCVNITATGNAALHGGQIQELLAYSLGIFSVLWILNGTYVCAGLAIFSAVVLQPIVGLPFLVIASTFVAYLLIVNDTGSLKKLIVPSLLSCCAIAYIAFVGVTSEGSNPSPPGILLTELTPSIFFNNISTWVRSDSLGLWWLSIAGFILLAVQGQIRRIEALIFSAWFLAALTIDGLFGATKWVVRFQSNYSTIGLLQLGWAAFILFGISKTKLLGRPARLCLTAIACVCWIVMNAYTLGFTWKPVSVFVNHSDVRLMRIADGIMPKNAKIFNMRPPENFNGWGQFCTGELWRPCWNHGFGSHEIASGNTRGTRQNLCSPTSDLFIKCLDQEGFNYLLLASRANSAEYATKLLQQGAIQELAVKSSFLFKLESGQDSSLR